MSRTYVFGYGSLIHSTGINGRGMKRHYRPNDLIECRLLNHRRSFNAVYDPPATFLDRFFDEPSEPNRFFGITREHGVSTNGVIFELSPRDWKPFYWSEAGSLIYHYPNVADEIEFPGKHKVIRPGDRILTCMVKKPSKTGFVSRRYIERCSEALSYRSPEFRAEFGDILSYLP